MANVKGLLCGLLSSASFGLIPLFTLPVMAQGMQFDSILFYRFLFAGTATGTILVLRKESFRISKSELLTLLYLSALYVCSALFLFWGYSYLPSGIATTIHFTYPVFVTLLMMALYNEKRSVWTFLAIIMAITGVSLLSMGGHEGGVNITGLFIVLISSVAYAVYIIRVNKSKVCNMNGSKLTFYVLIIGSFIFFINSQIKGNFQFIPNNNALFNLLMLALVPTVISNLALVYAIKNIGSTVTAILGAMEPVTAVCVGIVVFSEPFTSNIAGGILLIISAVSISILSRPLMMAFRHFYLICRSKWMQIKSN